MPFVTLLLIFVLEHLYTPYLSIKKGISLIRAKIWFVCRRYMGIARKFL